MKKILILNGPNLNLLGTREPDKYGSDTLLSILDWLQHEFLNVELHHNQSNHEGEIIDWIHKADVEDYDGIILNAGAFSHYSYAIYDAIRAIKVPVVEVHISNIHDRESFRDKSIISPVCKGSISGFGKYSYWLGIHYFVKK